MQVRDTFPQLSDNSHVTTKRRTPMPARSKDQQEAMAIAEHAPEKLYKRNRGLLKMTTAELHEYVATPRRGLPERKNGRRKPGLLLRGDHDYTRGR